jgi:hypothetical protein
MKLIHKKGYALALSIITMIILTIIGIGLYRSVESVVTEVKVLETESIKGHYAALSALRYASILLQNPEGLFTTYGGGTPINPGDRITISLWSNYNAVAQDMGLSSRHDIDLVITKRVDGEFDVSAIYYY